MGKRFSPPAIAPHCVPPRRTLRTDPLFCERRQSKTPPQMGAALRVEFVGRVQLVGSDEIRLKAGRFKFLTHIAKLTIFRGQKQRTKFVIVEVRHKFPFLNGVGVVVV